MGASAALGGERLREPARARTGAARVGCMSDAAAVAPVVGRGRRLARFAAVGAVLLAGGNLIAWGNRWYVSTWHAGTAYGDHLLRAAHSALVTGLVCLVVAAVAAVVGWRLRVVRAG